FGSTKLKLIPELTVVLPSTLYRFQDSVRFPAPAERFAIITPGQMFVNPFFEKKSTFFETFLPFPFLFHILWYS
ncbi:MAG: hypothetical protein MR021_08870, partial [Clostridiales bacterium]|nr:hypothetical protein [Clostridiales bacterium]